MLWFEESTEAPIYAAAFTDKSVVWSNSLRGAAAVVCERVSADLQSEVREVPNLLGARVVAVAHELSMRAKALPHEIVGLGTAFDQPASSLGYGRSTLLVVDESVHYASRWDIGPYCATVTVANGSWVSTLGPMATDPIRLISPADVTLVDLSRGPLTA